MLSPASALFMMGRGATPASRTVQMKTRQVANWWFRYVDSGRFLEKFMNLQYNAFVERALDKRAARSTGRRSRFDSVSTIAGRAYPRVK
jgi:hypothetical protein